jgi:small-conductance mechanosensitive channel
MLEAAVWRALGPIAAFGAAGLIVGIVLQFLILPGARRTRTWVGDLVNAVLRGPLVLWCVAAGLYIASAVLTLERRFAEGLRTTLFVLVVLSISWTVARLIGAILARLARPMSGTVASATLLANVVRLVVVSFGILVILQTLGVSITPVLTALGIGGLAVGLALQDTLANFFAGIHILSSRQVRPGDYVQLATGEEGYVQDVTWRYTTIRQLSNNLTIVPNSRLATTVLTNFYLPVMETTILVPVTVANDSDLTRVEGVSIDVAKSVMQDVAGGIAGFEPFLRYSGFGKPGVSFTIAMRGREIVDQHLIRHEFIKRLQERYRTEGIQVL